MQKVCPTCLGLGLIPVVQPPMPCPDCNGLGTIEVSYDEDDEKTGEKYD